MKSLNKKQYIILYVIIISIINLSIFITLTFIILNDKEKKEII